MIRHFTLHPLKDHSFQLNVISNIHPSWLQNIFIFIFFSELIHTYGKVIINYQLLSTQILINKYIQILLNKSLEFSTIKKKIEWNKFSN